MRPEVGPIYSVPLIETLPIGKNGGMLQQMASRQDLQDVRQISERVAAAYEVLLSHYREKCKRVAELEKQLGIQRQPAKEQPTSDDDDFSRIAAMVATGQQTWDLSHYDIEELRRALWTLKNQAEIIASTRDFAELMRVSENAYIAAAGKDLLDILRG